jgi:hypothetical protein
MNSGFGQSGAQFRPERIVASFILGFVTGFELHFESDDLVGHGRPQQLRNVIRLRN